MVDKNDPYWQFREILKSVRQLRGLKHGDIAKMIKISRPQYTAIEGGRSMISFQHIHNLAVALGVKIIIGDDGGPRMVRKYRERATTRAT